MQKTLIKSLLLIIAFTFALSANYIFAVWTGPIQTPPGGNTPTPLHIGSTDQVKNAGLALNSLAVFGNGFFDGNVGIGTVIPQAKLDVDGGINAAGKIKLGDDAQTPTAGAIRWTGTDFEGYDGAQWVSFTSGGGAGTLPFYGTAHTKEQCQAAGGTVTDYQSNSFCKFSASSCPGGWTRYAQLGSTSSGSCSGSGSTICGTTSCTTGNHNFTDRGTEDCSYMSTEYYEGYCNPTYYYVCSASLIEVGCY